MKILLRPQKSLDGLKNAGKPRKAVSQSTALRLQMLNLERKDKEKPMFYLFVNFPWLVMMPHLVPTTQYFPLMSPNFLARGTSYWPYASEWDRKNIKISKTWELPSPWLSSAWHSWEFWLNNLREEKRGPWERGCLIDWEVMSFPELAQDRTQVIYFRYICAETQAVFRCKYSFALSSDPLQCKMVSWVNLYSVGKGEEFQVEMPSLETVWFQGTKKVAPTRAQPNTSAGKVLIVMSSTILLFHV